MADHRGNPGEDADEVAPEPEAEQRGRRSLGDVEEGDRDPEAEAQVRQTPVAPGLPLPSVRMST